MAGQEEQWLGAGRPLTAWLNANSRAVLTLDTLKESVKPIASGEAPSYWLLVLALGVLVGESILYDRRKVG